MKVKILQWLDSHPRWEDMTLEEKVESTAIGVSEQVARLWIGVAFILLVLFVSIDQFRITTALAIIGLSGVSVFSLYRASGRAVRLNKAIMARLHGKDVQ